MLQHLRLAFLTGVVCTAAAADTLVIPNNLTTAQGNNPLPVTAKDVRFQEVAGSGQFPGPVLISGLRIRTAPGTGPLSFKYASFKVTLSTTPVYPNTNNGHTLPSATYADNVGPDATTVYNAPLAGSSPGCTGSAPCPFDVLIPFSATFAYDPAKGRLLVDLVMTGITDPPTGSYDGVLFPDTTTSSVAAVFGDPTKATGTLAPGGLVLGIVSGGGVLPGGSYGFLLSTSSANPSDGNGFAMLGLINSDGTGNVSGSYTFEQTASGAPAAQTASGTFTGSASLNPDSTGNLTVALDVGTTTKFAIVVTDGGKGLQMVETNCSNCSLSGGVNTGLARSAYAGPLKGSYGFEFNNTPAPAGTVGVINFDGAGNAVLSFRSVGVGTDAGQAPVSSGTFTGPYAANPDGSGTINFAAAQGQSAGSTIAFVAIDGGSGLLLLLTNGTTGSVSFGTARLQ